MDSLNYNRESPVPLNFEDLNRIESWTQMLADFLNAYDYAVIVHTKEWSQADIPWQDEIDRIRKNIEKLYKAFHYLPEWKEITYTNSFDYHQVNALEWDLQTIYTWLNRMVSIFWHSAEFYCNEGGIA